LNRCPRQRGPDRLSAMIIGCRLALARRRAREKGVANGRPIGCCGVGSKSGDPRTAAALQGGRTSLDLAFSVRNLPRHGVSLRKLTPMIAFNDEAGAIIRVWVGAATGQHIWRVPFALFGRRNPHRSFERSLFLRSRGRLLALGGFSWLLSRPPIARITFAEGWEEFISPAHLPHSGWAWTASISSYLLNR
jgi:hypothetical protein